MDGNGQEQDRELVVERAAAPTPLEVQLDSQKAIARIGAITAVIDGCAKISIQRTNHLDWVRQVARAKDGTLKESFYLQATGARKVRPIFGIYYRNRAVTKEALPEGEYAYLVTGEVGSKVLDQLYGEVTIEVDGGRSSSEAFFTGRDGKKAVDMLDVRKAALSNWEARAVTALLGLGNLSEEDLKRNGIDTSKIAKAEYQGGAEGGGQTGLISEAQAKRLYAISRSANVAEQSVKELLARYGWAHSSQIARAKYDEVCAVVQGGPAAVAKQIVALAGLKAEPQREPGEDG